MSTQKKCEVDSDLAEESVVNYLSGNPDFFIRQPELLSELDIPHECGGAVSLLEYQSRVLRDSNRLLKRRLEELLSVARDNDRVSERLHRLTLDLIEADSIEAILDAVKERLRSDFRADACTVRLLVDAGRANAPELVTADEPALELFAACLQEQRPHCGPLAGVQLKYLFGDTASAIGSTALLPIVDDETLGFLAIGSFDSERFHPGQGTIFLRQLGALLGRTLKSHLRD